MTDYSKMTREELDKELDNAKDLLDVDKLMAVTDEIDKRDMAELSPEEQALVNELVAKELAK